jgi:hypothetical protein
VADVTDHMPLHDMGKLFTRTDARVAAILEQGISERMYFLRVKVPRPLEQSEHVVVGGPTREQYVRLDSPIQSDLMGIIRDQLRHPARLTDEPTSARASRGALADAIGHRPGRRGPAR